MKKLMIIACAIAMFSCGNGKEVTEGENTENNTTEMVKDAVTGTVKDMTKTDGCDFIIEVTIDDKGEVIEPFSRCERNRAKRFWLVALAVTQERPNALLGSVLDATVFHVMIKPSLVDRHDGTQAHRNRWKLPEIGHQPRVRIGR